MPDAARGRHAGLTSGNGGLRAGLGEGLGLKLGDGGRRTKKQ